MFQFALLTVDTANVPDYLDTISKPMDYNKIIDSLRQGKYAPDSPSPSNDGENHMDAMENIVLKALKDIEQVHTNCFLYNSKDTPYYRAGVVQANKWRAYFTKHIKERLPETVQAMIQAFQEACAAENVARGSIGRNFKSHEPKSRSMPLAVFCPDTKRIVKQYTSKTAARTAALMLYEAGYACEWPLSQANVKFRIDNAEDPSKPIFGYQWVPIEKLKRGNFKVKPYFRNDDLVSPTPNNTVILKEDTISGSMLSGFESEEAAYKDWKLEMQGSFNARLDRKEEDSSSTQSGFVRNYVDGDKSINGIIWNRVPDGGTAMTPKSPIGKVVIEEEHAAMSPTKKGKSEEKSSK